MADGSDGLRIINIKDPKNPEEMGYYDTGDKALGVYVIDSFAYVADRYDGLYIIKFGKFSRKHRKKGQISH